MNYAQAVRVYYDFCSRMDATPCGRGWVGTKPPGCKRAGKGEGKKEVAEAVSKSAKNKSKKMTSSSTQTKKELAEQKRKEKALAKRELEFKKREEKYAKAVDIRRRMATGDEFRNVQAILVEGERIIRGSVPATARRELREAVNAGVLGHLKKEGLKPEIFFNPDHLHLAKQRQEEEALDSIRRIASVMASPQQVREGMEAMGVDPLEELLKNARNRKASAS